LGTVPVTVSTPTPFDANISGGLGPVGPVTLGGKIDSVGAVGPVTLAGIPDTFHFNIDKLPKLQIGVDPVELNIHLKEIPSVRAHMPADFSLGLSILGLDLLCVRLCGEAQFITEPYTPNACERCGPQPVTHVPTPPPTIVNVPPSIVGTPVSVGSVLKALTSLEENP
jgi:hypothetical protein